MVYLLPRSLGAAVRDAVFLELETDATADPGAVAVAAEDGIVTLTGHVGSHGVKVAAERAAKRVAGVRIVANDLHVASVQEHTDTAIAREALRRLRDNRSVPASVQAVVSLGRVTVDGIVSGMHQRLAAEAAVRGIPGVTEIVNDIALQTPDAVRM